MNVLRVWNNPCDTNRKTVIEINTWWAEKGEAPDVKALLTGNKSRNKHVFWSMVRWGRWWQQSKTQKKDKHIGLVHDLNERRINSLTRWHFKLHFSDSIYLLYLSKELLFLFLCPHVNLLKHLTVHQRRRFWSWRLLLLPVSLTAWQSVCVLSCAGFYFPQPVRSICLSRFSSPHRMRLRFLAGWSNGRILLSFLAVITWNSSSLNQLWHGQQSVG